MNQSFCFSTIYPGNLAKSAALDKSQGANILQQNCRFALIEKLMDEEAELIEANSQRQF
ncbi:hypothetical protein SLEP1_g52094 [Rubroshorea leprosula]|uniref:Uncharacterized protein n=1 Tax=Rubroshorea leprosula TaxID=152421 RepID=A0AAV5M7U5_9ROSI|nr:hypothetical protein SLEP1_g52094 [Rubroshorea leprosula]